MTICITCKQEYHRDSGPMISVCTPCMNAPKEPPAFVQVGGLLVPRDIAEEARLQSIIDCYPA